MTAGFELFANVVNLLIGLAALFSLIFGIWYFRDRKAREHALQDVRDAIEDAKPTDPQYNRARQVYAAASVEQATHSGSGKKADSSQDFDDGPGGGDGGGD